MRKKGSNLKVVMVDYTLHYLERETRLTDTPKEPMAGSSTGNTRRRARREVRDSGDDQPGSSRPKRRCVANLTERRLRQRLATSDGPSRRRPKTTHMISHSGQQVVEKVEAIENEVNELFCKFGDCDPDHIRTKLLMVGQVPNRVEVIYQELLTGGYPTLAERLRRLDAERQKAELLQPPTIEQVINRCEDIEGRLRQARKRKSEGDNTYRNQAVTFIANRCVYLPLPHIQKVVSKYNDLISAHEVLIAENKKRQEAPRAQGRRGTYLIKPRASPVAAPPTQSVDFTRDSFYIERQSEIQDYKERHAASKTLRYMASKSAGTLMECPVCLDNLLLEDMLTCPQGHFFCRTCIHLTVKEQASQGKTHFHCLLQQCDYQLDLCVLLRALPWSLYSIVEMRVTQEEVRRADLPGAVSCPHCYYTVVYPDDHTGTVFQCENPDCFKTSCRFCKEEAHVLVTCEQRANAKLGLQHHVEQAMTEAVVRTCWSCKSRFMKLGGCNHMRCQNCNSAMCYVCGQKLEHGYSHFAQNSGNKRCLIMDETLIHEEEIVKVLKTAEKEYKMSNPDADSLSLDYDPLEEWRKRYPTSVP